MTLYGKDRQRIARGENPLLHKTKARTMKMAKYAVEYQVIKHFEAKDRSEAKRKVIQECPSENHQIILWELDESGYIKGRVM